MRIALAALALVGCIDGVTQVAGTGATYTTACSAVMEARGDEYVARCTPPPCRVNYESAAVNHVAVAVDPGRKVVGLAERVCVQDLSQATALFQPMGEPAAPPAEPAPEDGDQAPAAGAEPGSAGAEAG